jgi:hypothetical protein
MVGAVAMSRAETEPAHERRPSRIPTRQDDPRLQRVRRNRRSGCRFHPCGIGLQDSPGWACYLLAQLLRAVLSYGARLLDGHHFVGAMIPHGGGAVADTDRDTGNGGTSSGHACGSR